ncbi:DNA polymerase III subunit delta [bacterium]|nr:DNA polymerase III subunit delta [bacterium]
MIVFIYGEDTYRSKKYLLALKNKFIKKRDHQGFSIINLDGQFLTSEQFRKNVLSAGLFSQKRLIIIKNILKNKNDNLFKEIISYLEKIRNDENNVVIFWEGIIGSNENTKLFSILRQEKFAKEFTFLKLGELINWIRKKIKKSGKNISQEALFFLAQKIGANLWQMDNEINKILAYCEKKKIIEMNDVKLLIDIKPEENIWLLINALGDKDKKSALKLLNDQIILGKDISYILAMLTRNYRILLKVKDVLNQKKYFHDVESLAKYLSIHPYAAKMALENVKKYSFKELKNIYQKLSQIDIFIKTSSLDPHLLLDLFITDLSS